MAERLEFIEYVVIGTSSYLSFTCIPCRIFRLSSRLPCQGSSYYNASHYKACYSCQLLVEPVTF